MIDNKNKQKVFLFGLLATPISQAAIDMYLPSFPAITEKMHTTPYLVQLTFTLYMLTYGASQIIYGPLSDSFGRKRIVLVGLVIFLLGTIMSMLSTSIDMLLFSRLIQGAGAGSTFLLTTVALGDVFSGRKLARNITFTSLSWSLTPIIAPMIGGFIQQYSNWRVTFFVILIYTAIYTFAVFKSFPETHPPKSRQALHLFTVIKQIFSMTTHRMYMGYVLLVVFSYGAVMMFNIVAPFILQDGLHISPATYGIIILVVGVFYSIGTFFNAQFLKFFEQGKLLVFGVTLTFLSGILLLVFTQFNWIDLTSILLPTFVLLFAQGFMFANSLSSAMETFPERRGSAGSLFACLFLLGITIITAISARFNINTQLQVAYLYIILGGLTIVSFIMTFNYKRVLKNEN